MYHSQNSEHQGRGGTHRYFEMCVLVLPKPLNIDLVSHPKKEILDPISEENKRELFCVQYY